MLYVARDGAGDITAICDSPVTVENLRALIDDNIVTVPTAGEATGDYVFIIDAVDGSQHIATSESEVLDYIISTPGLGFKQGSQFYGLPKDEAKIAMQAWLDDGRMANELTEALDNAVISEYRTNCIYSKALLPAGRAGWKYASATGSCRYTGQELYKSSPGICGCPWERDATS